MAAFAKIVLEQAGLGTDEHQRVGHLADGLQRTLASVDVVAGDAGYSHFGMFAFLPVQILLVAVSGFTARPEKIGSTLGSELVEKQSYVGFSLIDLVFGRIGILPALVMAAGVAGSAP